MKKIWIGIVRLFGWKFDIPAAGTRPEIYHCVMVTAPHTSAYDYFLGSACLWKMDCNAKIFMKKEYFNPITTPLLNYFGVVAVDRGNTKNNLVAGAIDMFRANDHFTQVITPEGTRKAVKRWKKGFYEIALGANVPIVLTYIDYKKKRIGVGPTIVPSGNFNADMIRIMQFYQDVTARNPEMFNKDFSVYNKQD